MLTIGIVLIIVSILLVIYSGHILHNVHTINIEIDNQNKELKVENASLLSKNVQLKGEIQNTEQIINLKEKELNNLQNNITKTFDNQKELSQKAFENYCEILNKQYEEEEQEYGMYKDTLQTAYSNLQLKLIQETNEIRAELDKVKATRTAAIQAQVREKELEEQLSFYCLSISESDIKDIAVLETVAPKLSKPRILYMLIWQTFYRTPMTNLCNNIIGTSAKSGIYKITNIKTKECYIGQAVDLASRWKDHAKCGLNIDTPAGNKLYKAMQECGIWNFSWEVLEEVPPAQLNEKEKYYIDLYDAKNYGYNATYGNSK